MHLRLAKIIRCLPLLVMSMGFSLSALSQSDGIPEMQAAIKKKEYQQALKVLNEKVDKYFRLRKPDSLVNYIFIGGKIHYYVDGIDKSDRETEALLKKIFELAPSDATASQAYIEAADYYSFAGDNGKAYSVCQNALKYAQKISSSNALIGTIENNLSTYAQRTGRISLAREHGVRAIKVMSSLENPDYELLYIAQNGMGAAMYYESKLDSAMFYFGQALISIGKAPQIPLNQFYRVAVLYNNMAGVSSLLGEQQKAIEEEYAAIAHLEKFIATGEEKDKESHRKSFLYQCIDNLGGLYKGIGDFKKAKELLEIAYAEKKNNLPPGNREVFNSQLLLGRLLHDMRDEEGARIYLEMGIRNLELMDDADPFWLADGYYALAGIFQNRGEFPKAESYYQKSDSLFQVALGGAYDDIYLGFLTEKSRFHAINNESVMAKEVAQKAYDYVLGVQNKESLAAFDQLLNLSEIEYLAKNYRSSYNYAETALKLLNKKIESASSLLDSIKVESRKPAAILSSTKASYAMQKNKTKEFIESNLERLEVAINIVERKRSFLNDEANNRILIAENEDLFDFVKQLNLELYRITNESVYIDRVMGLQESALYSRIRNRLNAAQSIDYAGVPRNVLQKERTLNANLASIAKVQGKASDNFAKYLQALDEVNNYRTYLKHNYPDYFRMRYQSVLSVPDNLYSSVPSGHTLVRYFFAGDSLYALVADNISRKIYSLSSTGLSENITRVISPLSSTSTVTDALFELYNLLWKPIVSGVHHRKIIVIPDGVLYNLNLEILTPSKIHSFGELATESLLARYTFSYQYSMLLMNRSHGSMKFKGQFAGFAPVFTDELKDNYKKTITDSLKMDRTYLTLLPQPFSRMLLNKLAGLLGGKSFVGVECTRDAFINAAGKNKVIHLGTHAVSDNINPAYSKLIFAKDKSGSDANVLYVNDLYQYSLPSALTVLSACETGKPGYMDGEGMISLAHAFNYAGSESMLTGLWNIDEKASNQLLEMFYENLLRGMEKDDALRAAKLEYLKNEKGRTANPHFWAGLVIMGDTSAIALEEKDYTWNYILEGLALMLAGTTIYIILKRRSRRKRLREV